MAKYILDTNTCIYVIKRRPRKAFTRFARHAVGDVGVSAITLSELWFGVANSAAPERNEVALTEFLAPLEVVAYTPDVGAVYGRIRAHLARGGKRIGPLDTLIAAHALHLGAVLVTNDVKEFSQVPLLKIENWV